ncbi:hypothetical protein DXZ79_00925 [Yersinia rochesterensis]|uniref:Uncharacterized protein n=1 Tax=Yersinia rochesterensis TaxID=1604335 RepID=A0A8D4N1K1_9GAMM|nr:hypothetical protein DXZ79_00925 [Yersinia rochesterensis]
MLSVISEYDDSLTYYSQLYFYYFLVIPFIFEAAGALHVLIGIGLFIVDLPLKTLWIYKKNKYRK